MKLPSLNKRLPKRSLLLFAAVLLALSFLTSYYFRVSPSIGFEEKKLEGYIYKQQRDYQQLVSDTALLRRLVRRKETKEQFSSLRDKDYGVFLYRKEGEGEPKLQFWNSQKILPPPLDSTQADGEYFQRLANGYYVVMKHTFPFSDSGRTITSYALIPVLYEYEVPSSYLRNHFAHDEESINKIAISESVTGHAVHSLDRKPLFYLERKAHSYLYSDDSITIILRISAFVLLLLYIHYLSESVARKRGLIRGILLLSVILILLRVVLYEFNNIFYFRQFQLFDPVIYAANKLNASLGDLLINAFLFCWLVLFSWYNMGPDRKMPYFLKGRWVIVAGVCCILVLITSTFLLADVIRSLVADSKISFNVTDFFSLSVYTVIGFVVLALLSLAFYYFTRLLFRIIFPAFNNPIYIYFIIAGAGLLFLSLSSGTSVVLFHTPVLVWLILYTLVVTQEQAIINRFRITVAGILFWVFIFSVSLAAIILQENEKKEWVIRKAIAEKYDQMTDPSSEYTLSIALNYLDNRFLLNNFHRFAHPEENRYLRDSIMRENYSTYINRYVTQLYVFDSSRRAINNDGPMTYSDLSNILTLQSRPTGIADLYYHETSLDQYTYITKRIVSDSTGVKGSFFIISTPKKYNSDALYPELFRAPNQADFENSPIYSYAIYNPKRLSSSSSKYPFQTELLTQQIPWNEFERRSNGEYDELWYKANSKKVIVIAKKQDSLIESITLFSYLFCAFLFMVALLQLLALVLRAANEQNVLSHFWQFNIRSQVHGTIIFISVFSFIVIGIATISFFIGRYNRNNVDRLSRTSQIMVTEMQKRLANHETFDDVIKIYDSVANQDLQELIDEVADIHNVDVNVYDLEGNLHVSSEADVYTKGILSAKMHPEAFYHLNRLKQVQHFQKETMSSLSYLSVYSAVRDKKGEVYAYLNIPYFLSQLDLNQEISNFLVTIINLNAFIFLIAGVVALFITNRITRSFSVIGDKMKEITLGRTNEEIIWNRNDEIGELIKQYNKMVRQLEQSAQALAKSEREGAWREMARQVAHEIKNPLTPMKLSIQYLQKAINNNQTNVKQLTSSVANTLVEQIDHLSKIAADFSRFANIGNRSLETFDLHAVVGSLVGLYESNPRITLHWNHPEHPVILEGDKTHMNRLFTNLLTNAVDACINKEECVITISEKVFEDGVLISIRDNGEGIDPEMQSKIFAPNFTTKSSGTGLGLAMCKSIVEQAHGSIWFETEPGNGATFFVQLPLACR